MVVHHGTDGSTFMRFHRYSEDEERICGEVSHRHPQAVSCVLNGL